MPSLAERIASELNALVTEGSGLLKSIAAKETRHVFVSGYQGWYTRALAVVRQLLPERLDDFQRQYSANRKGVPDFASYLIEDYLHGVAVTDGLSRRVFDTDQAAIVKFHTQLQIVASAKTRLSDILANIRGVLQADLFDSDLDAARHLAKNGHLRAAGAVAGVVLEGHLKELVDKHQLKLAKKKPTIADYNDALKDAGVFDIPTWRGIQRLADIRNLCDHKSDREPTADEVAELIGGTDKATKTLA